jgi:hypothetical protein
LPEIAGIAEIAGTYESPSMTNLCRGLGKASLFSRSEMNPLGYALNSVDCNGIDEIIRNSIYTDVANMHPANF